MILIIERHRGVQDETGVIIPRQGSALIKIKIISPGITRRPTEVNKAREDEPPFGGGGGLPAEDVLAPVEGGGVGAGG